MEIIFTRVNIGLLCIDFHIDIRFHIQGSSNISLVAVDDNLIDIIWEDQPEYGTGPVFDHPTEFAGSYILNKE